MRILPLTIAGLLLLAQIFSGKEEILIEVRMTDCSGSVFLEESAAFRKVHDLPLILKRTHEGPVTGNPSLRSDSARWDHTGPDSL